MTIVAKTCPKTMAALIAPCQIAPGLHAAGGGVSASGVVVN